MKTLDRLLCPLLMAAAMVSTAATGQIARAQDADEPDESAPAEPKATYTDEHFEQWVFGNLGNAVAGRSRLDLLLTLQIEHVDRTCGMSAAQKKKLLLAGKGDIKRVFDRVEEKRKRFQLFKNDQEKIGEFFQEIQPLQTIFQSEPFDEASLFSRTLKRTLNDEQSAQYEKVVRDKRQFRYRAKLDLVVATLDNSLGLSDEQREQFLKLLLEETQPPKRFGQYDYYVVLFQAAKLPEAKIKPIFDDVQWRLVSQQLAQAKGMEPLLKDGGFVAAMPVARDAVGGFEPAAAKDE
jgi:hypothetical protein